MMLILERNAPDANIKTASDAIWYVIVTMSTVGYGDRYPVSNPGRELGTFIIVVGVGIFGTLTGYLANLFLEPHPEDLTVDEPTIPEDARQQLQQLKELMEQQQAAVTRLELVIRDS